MPRRKNVLSGQPLWKVGTEVSGGWLSNVVLQALFPVLWLLSLRLAEWQGGQLDALVGSPLLIFRMRLDGKDRDVALVRRKHFSSCLSSPPWSFLPERSFQYASICGTPMRTQKGMAPFSL